jgi:hypothetical protein
MEIAFALIGVAVLVFAMWQMMFGGGPPTDGPDNKHSDGGHWPG